MITKIANNMLMRDPLIGQMITHPLSLGFTAFDVASGTSSLPQSLGGMLGGATTFNLGSRLADKGMDSLAGKISAGMQKNPRFRAAANFLRLGKGTAVNAFPKLRGATRFLTGMITAEPGFRLGRKAGEIVPGFDHKPNLY
jgi:hypothetical protein